MSGLIYARTFGAAVAVPETIVIPKAGVFDLLDQRVIRSRYRSPQRTKRRWRRDHERMMRDHARGVR